MINLLVDFNALIGDRRLLLADVPSEPVALGDRVGTYDEDDNSMMAVVKGIDPERDVLCLEPLWETWASGDEEPFVSHIRLTLESSSVAVMGMTELCSVRYGGSEGISYERELSSGVKIPTPA